MVAARNLLGKQRVGSAGAANNDIGRSHGLLHAVHRHRRNLALCRELGGTTRTGIDPNIGATALAQRRNGCTRVSARTKNQGASGRPVLLGNLIRKIQGNRHNRAALGAKRRVLTYLTSRMRRMLKQLHQLTGKSHALLLSLRLRGSQGAAYLTGDFTLANHGRLQAGGDRQQVARRLLVCVHIEAGIDQFLVQAGGLRNRINNQLTNHVHMRRDVQLNIHFKTVTGGKNYCTLNTELTCDIRRQNIGYARGTGAQRSDGGQINGVVRCHKCISTH